MYRNTIALLLCLLPLSALAVDDDHQALIDELRQLSDKAREQRAADRWLQRALDDLVMRYDWPWRKELVFDNFSDGNFEQLPHWQVVNGRFWVARGKGLRSRLDDRADGTQNSPNTQPSIEEAVIGVLLQQALGGGDRQDGKSRPPTQSTSEPHEIRLDAAITNAFAIETEFSLNAPDDRGRFALALLQGDAGRYGYRLRLQSGRDGFIELERVRGGRTAVVEQVPLPLEIDDNTQHRLAWRQAPNGDVVAELDAQPLFKVRDKAFRDGYQQLVLSHWSGDLTLHSIRISGTD